MDRKRIERIMEARVPLALLESSFWKEVKKLPPELRMEIQKYKEREDVKVAPPDIKGGKWSYAKAQQLLAEYWAKIMKVVDKHSDLRNRLEGLLMEGVEQISFRSNYEVFLLISLKSNPETLRGTKMPLIAVLLLLAIHRGDIGKTKKENAKHLERVLLWYLDRVNIIDWKELYELLKEILELSEKSGKGTQRMEKS